MASNVDICNLALSHCGVSSYISSMDEASNEAIVCKLHLPFVREAALRDFPWNFATRRVALALQGTPPTNWQFSYALPADCLMARSIVYPGARTPLPENQQPFEVAHSGSGRVLLTDMPEAELIYTARIENPQHFDVLFVVALAWGLAAEIAAPLSASAGLAKSARENYAASIARAAAASLREGHETDPEVSMLSERF